MTYGDAANLAVNQTLVRSINTSIVALLPVLSIIVVGAGLLGAGTLLDLAVALAVGMFAGAYSSIFIATPFLVQLKERQPDMKALESRVLARRKQAKVASGADDVVAEVAGGATTATATATKTATTQLDSAPRQQPRKQPRSKRK